MANEKLQIGISATRGLGTGGNPRAEEEAARQDKEKIVDLINGSELVFITAKFRRHRHRGKSGYSPGLPKKLEL